MAAPVVMLMVAAANRRRRRHSGWHQNILVALLIDHALLLHVVREEPVWPHVLEPVLASEDVIADMMHSGMEVVAVVPASILCIEEPEIVTEPYSSDNMLWSGITIPYRCAWERCGRTSVIEYDL